MTGLGPIYRGRLLIVEDDPLIACMEKSALEEHGFYCEVATGVREAIQVLRLNRFDLLILDHDLRDGKGLQILEWLENQYLKAKIIYISSNLQSTGSSLTGQYFETLYRLSKPIQIDQLYQAVDQLLPQSQSWYSSTEIAPHERSELEELLNSLVWNSIEENQSSS